MKNLRLFVFALLTASILVLPNIACNTTEGAGKDMQRAGEKIENAADRNK